MIRPKFKYYIKNGANYYVATSTGVNTTTVKTPLIFDPVEWDSVELKWTRNTRYHGLFRTVAIPTTFCKDGAKILRHLYYTQGFNAQATFEVEMIDENTQIYQPFFSSGINFTETICNEDSVQIALLDGGLPALLKAKEATPYPIPILDSDCLQVYMDGVKLQNRVYYSISDSMTGSQHERQFGPSMTRTNADADYLDDTEVTVTGIAGGFATIAAGCIFYTASRSGIVKIGITGTLSRVVPSGGVGGVGGQFSAGIIKNASASTFDFFINASSTATETVTFTNRQEISILVAQGDQLGFVMGSQPYTNTAAPATNSWLFGCDVELDIAYDLQLPPTTVRAHRQYTIWSKLMATMSVNAYGFVSSYLTNTTLRNFGNNPWNTLMTVGDAARGLGDGGSQAALLKVSLNDLLADASARDMLGAGIEGNNLRVEPLSFFYDNTTVTFTLGLVSNFRALVNQEWLYNLLKAGYNYNENDTLNGKQDSWTTFQYGTDATNMNKENDRISPFVASVYSWENKRSNLGKKPSTDDAQDNAVMLVEVSGSVDGQGRQLLYRPQNTSGNSLSGILAADTAFNLTLMPEYCVRRNGALLAIGLHLMGGTNLNFQIADQNNKAVSKLDSTLPVIIASASIPVSSLPAPLFLPISFEFETPVPANFKAELEEKPYGRINFSVRNPVTGQTLSLGGFVDEVNIKPGRNAVCSWKLLACPDTDLGSLIF